MSVYIDGVEYIKKDNVIELFELEITNRLNTFKQIFENDFNNAKEAYEDFKKEGLTFGAIEAEGAYRQLLSTGREMGIIPYDEGETE